MLFLITFILPLVSLSVYLTLCVFYPKIRGSWRGSTQAIGTMSAIGMALYFDGTALIVLALVLDWPLKPAIMAIMFLGILLTGMGYFRDEKFKR